MARVAVLITDLFEDIEYTSPRDALAEAGHRLATVGITAGSTVKGKKDGTEVWIEVGIDDASGEDFDALLIPGGYSPDKLRKDERALDFVRHFSLNRKPIFLICHAVQLLVNAQVLQGKDVTCVSQCAIDATNAGANYYNVEVVIDPSGIISSRGPDDLPAFNKAITAALE